MERCRRPEFWGQLGSTGEAEVMILKRKYWTMFVAAGAAISCGAVAYAAGFTLPAPAKIAFLYFDQKNDGGWTQAFDEARPKIEKALGMKIPYVCLLYTSDAADDL